MLKLCNIVKNYPTATTVVQALKGVTLSFREHEFVAILGPSGCGKSTMLNIIGGLDRYTDGDLLIGGVSTKSFDDLHWDAYRNATIGFVFQSYNLIPHLNVLENVEMGLNLAGVKKKERRARAVAALHRVGMGDEINKRPNQLSGGQMQRVAIARALVTNPKIILADEPTGALDSELSVQVMDLLKEISENCLVIMVTHNAELAQEYCSRICRFKDGQLISDSDPYEGPDDEPAEELSEEETTENVSIDELPDEDEAATTDTVSLEDEEAEKQPERLDIQPEEEDFSKLYALEEEDQKKDKHVSNRKRKKEMKQISSSSKETFERLGLESRTRKKKTEENRKDKTFKPISMNAVMAFGLSLRNLLSKKGRTAFTAFASSIGIIGLGLVLSISNGFSLFVDKMQTEMMAGMPLGIYEYNVEVSMISEMMNVITSLGVEEGAFPDSDGIKVEDSGLSGLDDLNKLLSSFLGNVDSNYLTEEFDQYIKKMDKADYAAISTYYGLRYNMIAKTVNSDGEEVYRDVSKAPPVSSVLSIAMTIFGQKGLQPDYWQLLVGDEQNMLRSYDLIGENSRYPQNSNELLLCVSETNSVAKSLLDAFGIDLYERDAQGNLVLENGKPKKIEDVKADSFIGKTVRLVYNDDYYKAAETEYDEFDLDQDYVYETDKSKSEWTIHDDEQELMEGLYNGGRELKIVGIIRPKKDSSADYVSNAICYTPELQEELLENSYNSKLANKQRELLDDYADSQDKMTVFGSFDLQDDDLTAYQGNPLALMQSKRALSSFLREIGAIKQPSYINIYPSTYDQKLKAGKYISAWNDISPDNHIGYLDVSEMIIYNLNVIINLVSILLIAVASISLVVSTAMIGVITSNSVIERIREIGILRALGARKRDIRNVFVAETSLLGLAGGVLGIVITYILCPIISAIIGAISGVGSLLHFHPLHALLLVALSLALTVISGVIPAIMASRKNVVDALRVE